MKVTNCRISSKVEATIKFSWLKSKNVSVPTRKVMYAFSHPNNWDEIDKIEFNKDSLKDFARTVYDMIDNDGHTLAEILLKIAGEHPNAYENEMFKKLLSDREFAKNQYR
ncbi:MAG: hypothetical protein H6588_08600 [Flavobacteriales bacterium]|nr:hypothetical protein [Flavobacteriales bacterium]